MDCGYTRGKEPPIPLPITEVFAVLPDPRRDIANQRHGLTDILTLAAWGESCHLRAADRHERQQLGEALTADDRRECVSRTLADWSSPQMVDAESRSVKSQQ